MTTMTTTLDRHLSWRQPEAWNRAYELRSDRGVVGVLRFPSWLRFSATGQIGDRSWKFQRKGFLTQRIEVLEGVGEAMLAEYTERFPGGSGTVTLRDGRRYEASNNFLLTEWKLMDGSSTPLIHCHHARGILHSSASVDIRDEAPAVDAEPWLVLLGWYLLVLKHGDSP